MLKSGRRNIGYNVRKLEREGYAPRQAVAISLRKARVRRRRKRNPATQDYGQIIKWSVIAIGAYFVYRFFTQSSSGSSSNPIVNTVQNTASSLTDWIQNNITGTGIAQPGQSYTVTMCDGSVQTVPYGQSPTPVNC